jgi:hypothetical protein
MPRLWHAGPDATLNPMTDDAFLLAHSPGPTVPVARSVGQLRDSLAQATLDLSLIRDASLETGWRWGDDEADVRYGLYRCIEAIDDAAVEVARILRDTGGRRTPSAARIAGATAARWDLHGLLATMDSADLDRHPAATDWTVRETLGHIVGGQRAYGWFTAWWASRPPDEPVPDSIPPAVVAASGLPDEDTEGSGTLTEVRARFDAVLDLAAGRSAHLDDEGIARPARWAGIPVTVGFRLGRWSSHLVEHTLQIDKTMALLGRSPSEVGRLIRLIHAAHGRLEAHVFPIDSSTLAVADPRGRSVDQVLESLARDLVVNARSARDAAAS